MSFPVSVLCDGVWWHVLCLYTVTGWVSCPVSVYCDGVGCHVLCLLHGIPVWLHNDKSTTATGKHNRDYDLKCSQATLSPNKQTNKRETQLKVFTCDNILFGLTY